MLAEILPYVDIHNIGAASGRVVGRGKFFGETDSSASAIYAVESVAIYS